MEEEKNPNKAVNIMSILAPSYGHYWKKMYRNMYRNNKCLFVKFSYNATNKTY